MLPATGMIRPDQNARRLSAGRMVFVRFVNLAGFEVTGLGPNINRSAPRHIDPGHGLPN